MPCNGISARHGVGIWESSSIRRQYERGMILGRGGGANGRIVRVYDIYDREWYWERERRRDADNQFYVHRRGKVESRVSLFAVIGGFIVTACGGGRASNHAKTLLPGQPYRSPYEGGLLTDDGNSLFLGGGGFFGSNNGNNNNWYNNLLLDPALLYGENGDEGSWQITLAAILDRIRKYIVSSDEDIVENSDNKRGRGGRGITRGVARGATMVNDHDMQEIQALIDDIHVERIRLEYKIADMERKAMVLKDYLASDQWAAAFSSTTRGRRANLNKIEQEIYEMQAGLRILETDEKALKIRQASSHI